jgi:DNA repair protein RadD
LMALHPAAERDEILARLASGDLELVSNCAVLLEGWDSPSVSCCILARPTKSFGLYRQMLGRVLRPAEGKENALILDHAGAVYAHGFAEDEVCWSLDPDTKATNPTHAARGTAATRKLVECVKCHAVRTAGLPCGHCGYFPRRPGEFVITRDGELAHLTRDGELHASQYSPSEKVAFYRGLLHLAAERGNKPGAAAYRFKDKFGDWPPRRWSEYGPAEPTPEVIAWDRHCRIRFAKSMQKAQAVNA